MTKTFCASSGAQKVFLFAHSLSVDNIFVFVLVFGYFAIPAKYQHRVLFYGIVGALIFRAIFIALG